MKRTTEQGKCWSSCHKVRGKKDYEKGSCKCPSGRTSPSYKKKSNPSKGWSKMAPKKGKKRTAMLKKCGSKCFLDAKNKKYPICAKGSCKVNKKGLHAAYSRSREWHHEKIAKKAKKQLKKKSKSRKNPNKPQNLKSKKSKSAKKAKVRKK